MAVYRSGISDNKVMDLYPRYGLLYRSPYFADRHRKSHQEPPTRLRRVERPIRLRVHWTCHECNTRFGMENLCPDCGHRKCVLCSRHPPRGMKDVLDNGRYMAEQSELSRQESMSSVEAFGNPSTNSMPILSAMPSPSLDRFRDIDAGGESGLSSPDYTFYTRPSAAVCMFEPDCRHVRCEQYFQSNLEPDERKQGLARLRRLSKGELPTIKAVRRVYRKPRQRVRYTCEQCATKFVEGDRCRECGHDRCNDCIREP